jgi:hypothetical protein
VVKSKKYKFVIRLASAERASIILKFHTAHVGEYLWPRTLDEIKKMIEDECLYELVESHQVGVKLVGICYIAHAEEPNSTVSRREFGGIFLLEKYRGKTLGLAKFFGMAAISEHFIWDNSGERMIAHVHEENALPRRLLTQNLGFNEIGKETPPRHIVPKNMRKNKDGDVVGDLFEFQREKLADFATWLSTFRGTVKGEVTSRMKLDLTIGRKRKEAVKALLKLSHQ